MSDDDWIDGPNQPLDGDKPPQEPAVPLQADPWVSDLVAEEKRREDQSMPDWLPAALAGTVAWMVLGIWLSQKAGWPQNYGYHSDCIRACLFEDVFHSPALLEQPSLYSLALFTWYVVMAALAAWVIVHAALRKPRRKLLHALGLVAAGLALRILLNSQGAR